MAIILREMLDDFSSWDIHIDGVDISRTSLEKALAGYYSGHALRETPYIYRDNYFTRTGDSTYLLDETVRNAVSFYRVNLFDKDQVAQLFLYDFIFLRNVMIYFDRESTARVMEYLYNRMKPGGYLFVGLAESVARMTDLFKMERIEKAFVYQK
jgi:chemotaxis protein methyltransferase CheR